MLLANLEARETLLVQTGHETRTNPPKFTVKSPQLYRENRLAVPRDCCGC